MVVTCPSCYKKFRVNDAHFQGRNKIRFCCTRCQQPIEVLRNNVAEQQAAAQPATQKIRKRKTTWNADDVPNIDLISMPEGKRVSLAVLRGAEAGKIFPVEKPIFLIGRAGADAVLSDGEVSRHHARLELQGSRIILRDLKSTNGTYVNEQRVSEMIIDNQTEFRIGATTLMVIITDGAD